MPPTTLPIAPNVLTDPRLGRLPQFDLRSLQYPMEELVATSRPIRSKDWNQRQFMNQGQKPHCVGYSISLDIGMQPYYHNVTDYLADLIYYEAQKIDYWPGEGYAGTSVLAGMQIALKMGFYKEFRWALKPDPIGDICRTLSYVGPVVMGTKWTTGMYHRDADGTVHPTGTDVGGHAYVLRRLDWPRRRVYSPNSWGDEGFWLTLDDLESLIYDNGEAAVPVVRD